MPEYNDVHFRSHVERCLQQCWQRCDVETDHEGDYVFTHGTAACFVRIEHADECVRAVAIAAVGLRRSFALLKELNDLNVRAKTARCFFVDGAVIVEQTVLAAACTPETLGQACQSVGGIANGVGDLVARVHGGSTLVPADPAAADRTGSD